MRIKRLSLLDYKNLRNFVIEFDPNEPSVVLLGHNSAGKSNLIEAIVEIFRELDSGKPTEFPYEILYETSGNSIEITCNPKESRPLIINVNGEKISITAFRNNLYRYLPQFIFGYYSGWSDRLEKQFDEKTRRYYSDVLNNDDIPFRRFFFCRKEYSQLVLLAFFLIKDPDIQKQLFDYLDITEFQSALFVLRRPWWGKTTKKSEYLSTDSDPRFWHARGSFTAFLDLLWENALAPIRNTEIVERDIRRRGEQTERLYLYIKNIEQLRSLQEENETIKLFFMKLESLYLCDLVDEVRIKVKKEDGSIITFKELSEGEQQLLTVLGLLIFTQSDESLYLFDEPNTHLNPVWTYTFLNLLQKNLRIHNGHMIISTHDPLMVSGLYKSQVRLIEQKDRGATASEPEYDPIGIGIEGLLKSELYGLESTLAPEILEKLTRQYLLLGKKERTDAEEIEVMKLAQELNSLGVSRTHPNPYFEQFANAMARRMPEVETPLTKEDIQTQAKLADEILDEILAEEEKLEK